MLHGLTQEISRPAGLEKDTCALCLCWIDQTRIPVTDTALYFPLPQFVVYAEEEGGGVRSGPERIGPSYFFISLGL